MTARQESKLDMINLVITHCDNNAATVATIPAFGAAVTTLKATRDLMIAKRNIQMLPTDGVTEDKALTRKNMEEAAHAIASKGYAYAVATANNTLKEKFNYSPSDLGAFKDGEIDGICQNIHDDANTNAAALVPYGVIAGDITTLQTLVELYVVIKGGPRGVIVARKTAGEDLVGLFKQADGILKDQMDRLSIGFKTSAADFYNAYKNARIIVDPGSSSEEEETPPTPPTP